MDTSERILQTIKDHSLLLKGDIVIAAVSGGPDSTLLIDFLDRFNKKLGVKIHVFHLDHMLRDAQSRADLEFVKQLSADRGIPCTAIRKDIKKLKLKRGGSTQVLARNIRREELEKLKKKIGATKIATAHHLDDRIETFLQRLLRGSGKKGLGGISYTDGTFIRPLLDLSKVEILDYLSERRIQYREDPTNSELKYFRNKIRLKLIPALKDISPGYQTSIKRFMDIMDREQEVERDQAGSTFTRLIRNTPQKKSGEVDLPLMDLSLLGASELSLVLREAIRTTNPHLIRIEKKHTDLIIRAIKNYDPDEKSGKARARFELPDRTVVIISSNKLTIKKASSQKLAISDVSLKLPGTTYLKTGARPLKIVAKIIEGDRLEKFLGNKAFLEKNDKNTAYLDLLKCGNDLTATKRRPGDKMRPLGLKGQKKVQDILVDAKVPVEQRDLIPMIRRGQDIIWIAGVRMSHDMRVTPATTKVLQLRLMVKDTL